MLITQRHPLLFSDIIQKKAKQKRITSYTAHILNTTFAICEQQAHLAQKIVLPRMCKAVSIGWLSTPTTDLSIISLISVRKLEDCGKKYSPRLLTVFSDEK